MCGDMVVGGVRSVGNSVCLCVGVGEVCCVVWGRVGVGMWVWVWKAVCKYVGLCV